MTDEGKITSALVPSILELKVRYLKSCSYVDSKSLPIDQSDHFRFFEGFGFFSLNSDNSVEVLNQLVFIRLLKLSSFVGKFLTKNYLAL